MPRRLSDAPALRTKRCWHVIGPALKGVRLPTALSALNRQERMAIAFRCCLQLAKLDRLRRGPPSMKRSDASDASAFALDCPPVATLETDLDVDVEDEAEWSELLDDGDAKSNGAFAATVASGSTVQAYLGAVKRTEHHTPALERQLFDRWHAGDIVARDALIRATLWLVPVVVRRFAGNGILFEDLVEEGNLALFEALDRFDPARGVRFSTYAKWWILKFAVQARRDQAYPLRVPRPTRPLAEAVGVDTPKANDWPTVDPLSAAPTLDEIAPRQVRRRPAFQLDSVTLEDAQLQLDQLSADAVAREFDSEVEEVVAVQQAIGLVLHEVDSLPARERLVLEHRYGLRDKPIMTLQELGATLGLSAEGVRKIQLAAMKKIKATVFPGL